MAGTVQLFLLMLAVLATAKPPVRWAQSNSTLYLELSPPKGQSCQEVSAEILFDRVVVSSRCADGQQSWELELREDVWTEHSRLERLPNRGTLLLMLRKKLQHRWDRPLMDEASFTLPKDWKREDTSLPEEDEMELPRAQNIKRFGSQEELQEQLKQNQTLVLAMRYPWCTACEEKDKAFVKVSKVVAASLINASKAAGKDTAQVRFGAVDLREAKVLARRLWSISELHECRKTSRSCPLLVFKPDEPLEEPYQLQVQLLYEMDEAAMMADPMAGMPGHKPQGQTPKPDYKRFQHELSLLLPPAVHHGALDLSGSAPHGRSPWVLGRGVNATEFRWAARNLRGIASFARTAEPGEPAFVKLWRGDGSTAIPYNGPSPLNSSHLEDFTRIHAQPIVQNYSWALRDSLDAIGLPLGVLWVNYSDGNSSNTTHRALSAFEHLCSKRRGTNRSQHILCCVMDQSHAYHQREYGSHEPYPFPFFGLTHKLGFHAGDRYGYPFREPVNASVYGFFSNSKRAARQMDAFAGRVLRGRVPPSHESNVVPNRSWRRGEVQEIVWKTYQKEINGSTADVLLELYDDQRKKHHWLSGSMDVLAQTLKDYADLKVARMEVSQNYVPPIFGRKQYSKETEFYWVPPSLATGQWTPSTPVRYAGAAEEVTPGKLLRFLKKHTLSSWSLKEALESSDDIGEEVMTRARLQQQADDRAEEEKQQMIKKMMTTLKKEKGLVDMNEVMGLRQAAEALKPDAPAGGDGGAVKKGKGGQLSDVREASEEMERKRQLRREELKKEEAKRKEIARKDKEKKKRRLEAEKLRKEKKKVEEEERRKVAAKLAEEKRRQREVERLRQVATPLFSWGQSKEQIRMSISIPGLQKDSVNVTLDADRITVYAADWQKRRYLLDFELRGFIEPSNSSWSEEETAGRLEGLLVTLRKSLVHRWDRLAQNHSAVKNFLRKDWVQDDGEVEEEQEEVELPSGPNVKKVSSSGVQRLLEKRSLVVLAPRFPWCDKCKEKDREFVKAAKGSRDVEHLDTVAFASMDAREEKHWARKYNVTCDDTCELLLFKSDEEEPYVVPGKRFSEELQVECYKHLLPVVSTINDRAQFERLKGAFDTAIIGFFRQEKSSDAWFPRFQQAARALRGHALFGAVFRGHTPSTMGIEWEGDWDSSGHETRPLVLLFKPKEERHVEFTGELTLEKLSHFSKVLSLPLLSPYTPESRQKYIELKVPLAMLWLDGEDEAHPASRAAREVAERLAHRFSGQLVFVTLNTTRDGFLLRPFGLDPRAPPLFGLASEESTEAQRFAWRQTGDHWLQPSFEGLEAFCQAFLNGSLEASHESGVLPESYKWPGPGSVEEVVWTTFRSSVRESEHLLLELYSPYRPQHRTHLVVLDLVAEALAKLTTIKVARMDTANNYVLPEFALKDKEKSSSIFFRLGPQRWRRFAPKTARLEELPAQMLKFLHREMKGNFDLPERLAWVKEEVARMDTANNYVLPEFALKDKEKSSSIFFRLGPQRWRRFAPKTARLEELPAQMLKFLHREMKGNFDLPERLAWVKEEAWKRIRRLKALEKDYEKKMQDEWMQKEIEEFERYKRLGKFDSLNL